MENLKSIHTEISSANIEYRAAVARSAGISAAKERLKNLLFNHREVILSSLLIGVSKEKEQALISQREERLKKENEILSAEIASMDEENNELRKKIREMEKEQAPKKRRTKTMTAVVE